jgi:nucleoid-associated protein YgaU
MLVLVLTGCGSMKSLGGSPSDIALAEENYKLKNDQEKLRQQLADAKAAQKAAAATPAPAAPSNELKQQLEVAEEKLEQALRSYTQSQKENARLQAELDKADAQNAVLHTQVSDLKAKVDAAVQAASAAAAAAPTPTPAPVAAPIAAAPAPAPAVNPDTEANLATALRSYALLREESDQVKSERDKLAAEKIALQSQISALKGAMPLASQAEGLRDQLRQTQAQSAAFAEENARLKTQLSLTGGAAGLPASRSSVITPVAVATVPDAVPTPTPVPTAPEPRVHTVVAGDTLSKIALKYYGTASRWPEILAANRDTLKNENSLVAGKTIRIP